MSFLKQKPTPIISLSLNFVFAFFVIYYALNNRESLVQKWIEKRGKATIVMFGDSHTGRTDWNVLLSRCDVKRSGYGGFTSEQLSHRISMDVIRFSPQVCFVQCGGNDINSVCFSADKVVFNLSNIIDSLQANGISPVIQSLFHRYGHANYNSQVDTMNILIQKLVYEKGAFYLDIDSFIVNKQGLRKELTKDNIHLNEKGNEIWAEQVKAFLLENGF